MTSFKTRIVALGFILALSLAWTARGECQLQGRAFEIGSYTSIHLEASKWCVELEAVNNSFNVTDIDVNTVKLFSNTYPVTGDVTEIYPMNKTFVVADRDNNGIQDVEFCFSNADINALFSRLHGNNAHLVHLGLNGKTIQGALWYGGSIDINVYPKN